MTAGPNPVFRSVATVLSALAVVGLLAGCRVDPAEFAGLADAPEDLAAWGLFEGDGSSQEPVEGVIPYDLISPLFSDYALKLRFVKLPPATKATYSPDEVFGFPVGTVIAKTFAYPADLRRPDEDVRLLETRLLIHQAEGWIGLPYVWNEEQTEARLKIAGAWLDTDWIDFDGTERRHTYLVPNANQCKGCHRVTEDTVKPIGLKARYLNREFSYPTGPENQLAHWSVHDALDGAPSPLEVEAVPIWDDPTSGSVEERARTYLEINCAHCHNPGGPGRTTGLDLTWGERLPRELGVFKSPIAAGRGTGDRLFGIVPGRPDESILYYRLLSVDPGVMMPELGRRLVHAEGNDLIRQWIEGMELTNSAEGV